MFVSFCMFLCSKRHWVRAYLPRYYLKYLSCRHSGIKILGLLHLLAGISTVMAGLIELSFIGRSSNISMRVRDPIKWDTGVCDVQKSTRDKMKRSVTSSGYLPTPVDTTIFNLAHVFPCGQMKHNVEQAVFNWGPHGLYTTAGVILRLRKFAMWLFEIDLQATIQEMFMTGNNANLISFEGMYSGHNICKCDQIHFYETEFELV